MKRKAQPILSEDGQQALDQYRQVLQQIEDLSPITIREYLQTTLGLKPSTVNRALMSLKRYFAWIRKTQLIQSDPARPIKFVPKEAVSPRHLSNEEEEALVAA